MMLDSGSSLSLIQQDAVVQVQDVVSVQMAKSLRLVTASGDQLPILDYVQAPLHVSELRVIHEFVVVQSLVAPVILGVDFLQKHSLVLDFSKAPVFLRNTNTSSKPQTATNSILTEAQPIYDAALKREASVIAAINQPNKDECVQSPPIKSQQALNHLSAPSQI